MIPLTGKYGEALIMIDNVEEGVISQTLSMLNTPPFTNPVRIMPDTHEGKGSVIGFTEKCNGKVCPNTIGVDIGCGVDAYKYDLDFDEADFTFEILDEQIRSNIPLGFNIHNGKTFLTSYITVQAQRQLNTFTKHYNDMLGTDYTPVDYYEHGFFTNLCKKVIASEAQVINAMGTLGGGNHFIEVDIDRENKVWLVVHSGSRNFGLKIANYHQKKAGKSDLAYLEGEAAYEYFVDMFFAQQYAASNRRLIADVISDTLSCSITEIVESIHNYVDPNDMVIRKGAIRSYEGEKMVIPFNMRDGTIIAEGKSNPEWNFSAPHGAGRVMSRTQAKKNLSLDKYVADMKGICSTSVNASTLDECPDCYKDYQMISAAIEPTAKILYYLKPVYNLKA
ncbi:MAG: RtcB family protein [Candidatus Babeliales bacterium]|jgi:RNA-splicing ligase RtcB